jgi:hypothetical protein
MENKEPKIEEVNKGGRPHNCKKCNKPKGTGEGYCNCGRPTVMTPDVIAKLEDAFMFSFTDEEACFYANISVDALYDYQKENPEFAKRKKALKLSPNLAAKKELVSGIKGNLGQARWWAEKKMNNEFGDKTTIKHEGSIDFGDMVIEGDVEEAVDAFNERMRIILTKRKKAEDKKEEVKTDEKPAEKKE